MVEDPAEEAARKRLGLYLKIGFVVFVLMALGALCVINIWVSQEYPEITIYKTVNVTERHPNAGMYNRHIIVTDDNTRYEFHSDHNLLWYLQPGYQYELELVTNHTQEDIKSGSTYLVNATRIP
jgi:hypothetical protein